jgi:hypothetical protein
MKRLFLYVLLSVSAVVLYAQQFTEVLRTKNNRGGVVVVQHSAVIDSLVNGLKVATPIKKKEATPVVRTQVTDTTTLDSLQKLEPKGYVDKQGYRIQIYSGANSRESKSAAMSMRAKSLKLFPEMKAYCNFVSPRWIVRIGDFTNREQAMEQLKKVRESGLSKEVRLVRCKVKMPVY